MRAFFATIEREKRSKISQDELAVMMNNELNMAYYRKAYLSVAMLLGINPSAEFENLLQLDTKKEGNRRLLVNELLNLYLNQNSKA
jgi:hypothetical protein